MSAAQATGWPSNWRWRMSAARCSAGRSRSCRRDDQNKPDVAASLAREWIDNQGVDVLMDGAASSSGLAIQQIAREKKHIYLITGPATSDMTGKQCSPYGIQFVYDTYALAHGTGSALTKAGGDTLVLHHRRLRVRLCAGARHHRCGAGGRRQGAGHRPRAAGHRGFLQLPGAGEGVRRQGVRLRQCRHRPAELHQAGGGVRPVAGRRRAWRRC